MGTYCCSNQKTEGGVEVPQGDLSRKVNELTMEQIALIIMVQAHIRGFLARKQVNLFRAGSGMGQHQFYNIDGQILQNYDNPKVQEIRQELGDFDFNVQAPHQDNYQLLIEKLELPVAVLPPEPA